MLKIAQTRDVPEHIIIQCPITTFKPRRGINCMKCEFYGGLGIMIEDETLPWHERYAIRCGHIIERRTHVIPEIIEE